MTTDHTDCTDKIQPHLPFPIREIRKSVVSSDFGCGSAALGNPWLIPTFGSSFAALGSFVVSDQSDPVCVKTLSNLLWLEAVGPDKLLEGRLDAHGPSLEWVGITQDNGAQGQ
jgi:hypothetical protein